MYIYLSNEQATLTGVGPIIDVFFDDLTITQEHTPIVSKDDYYPFGLSFNSYQKAASTEQKFKHTGKEEQEEWGVIDFGARFYQADLGRWFNVDPLADNSISMTPYHYTANNPIIFIDPDGMDWFYYKQEGNEEATWNWHDGSKYNTGVKNDDGK